MRICLVTDFGQDEYFQWKEVWNIDMQIKYGVIVCSKIINPSTLGLYPDNHPYWRELKIADVVFVYSTRTIPPDAPYNIKGIEYRWNWYDLPKLAKKYMRPEAKMIAQWDDEFIWLQHPEWVWWAEIPDTHGGPDQFFKDIGILEVPDMFFTVLDEPYWNQYVGNKPVKYMPLPHLWRYSSEMVNADLAYQTKDLNKMHKSSVAILKHTSHAATVYDTMKNVINKVGLPVTYFSTQWSEPTIPKYKVPVTTHLFINRDIYMATLLNDCNIAIDDADKYIGWSRFVMECAINYIPCIGSNHATKLFFPDLYTNHNDYPKQIELIKQLLKDEQFYKRVVEEGNQKMKIHLNPERLCGEMIDTIKKEFIIQTLPVDIELELMKNILRKSLPFIVISKRPSENQNIYDDIHHRKCNQAQWDIWYGRFERFISDEQVYNRIIREVLDEK